MARLTLWLFVIVLGLELGAGLYETRIVVPLWAGGVPDTLAEGNPYARVAINAGLRFWAIVTPAVGLLAVLTIAFGFRTPMPQRTWRLGAAILELAVIASTLLYFRPTLIRLFMGHGAGLSPDALTRTVRRWVVLSRVRVLMSGIAWGLALAAFGA